MLLRRLIWGILLGLFFVSSLYLSLPFERELFVSPDENAAYVFAKALANSGRLAIPEALNTELGGILHPRSTVGFGNAILPGSFIGFILVLGGVGAIFGNLAMYLVTPVLAVLAIIAWRDVVRRAFANAALADAAAFLLMIHPAFWYYSGRVMMHNVAFLALLVGGIWLCLAQPLTSLANKHNRSAFRLLDFFIGGSLFGLALVARTSEVIWLSLSVAGIFLVYRTVLGWRAMAAFGVGVCLLLGVLGAINAAVYGSPFATGYTVNYPYQNTVSVTEVQTAEVPAVGSNYLLPFGFHERVILSNVINYGWKLYPWMSVLAVIGLLLVAVDRGEQRNHWRVLAIFTLVLAAWFAAVYGSWKIIDNPDPTIISLGNSHVRYWLPLFALASIFGARTLVYLLGDRSWLRQLLVGGLVVLLTLMSLRLVFYGHDGFVESRQALATFAAKQERILGLTEEDSIVIVDRADKYLFPERRVVVPLRDQTTYASIPLMLEHVPVYYFGITFPPQDIEHLNNVQLAPLNVRIELVETMNEESLYRFLIP